MTSPKRDFKVNFDKVYLESQKSNPYYTASAWTTHELYRLYKLDDCSSPEYRDMTVKITILAFFYLLIMWFRRCLTSHISKAQEQSVPNCISMHYSEVLPITKVRRMWHLQDTEIRLCENRDFCSIFSPKIHLKPIFFCFCLARPISKDR